MTHNLSVVYNRQAWWNKPHLFSLTWRCFGTYGNSITVIASWWSCGVRRLSKKKKIDDVHLCYWRNNFSVIFSLWSAHLSLNHIHSGDQNIVSEEEQTQLEDLLQDVQTFEHNCMETSDNLLNAEKMTALEEDIQIKVQEFQSQLQQILSRRWKSPNVEKKMYTAGQVCIVYGTKDLLYW